jgi:hypothetical protein
MKTLMDLGLTKMNQVFTIIVTNKVLSQASSTTDLNTITIKQWIRESMDETIHLMENIINIFEKVSTIKKRKILQKKDKLKKLPTVETVLNAIENRQQHMIEHAQYQLKQTIKIKFLEEEK